MCGGDIFGSIARLALASASFGTSELFGVGKKVGNMFSNKPNMEGKRSFRRSSSLRQSKAKLTRLRFRPGKSPRKRRQICSVAVQRF